MSAVTALEQRVRALYEQRNPERATEWADWLYQHHVFVVADFAERVARQMGADVEVARAAAMLHDIADAVMPRDNPQHAAEGLKIARGLLKEAGFGEQAMKIILDDALPLHSCHGDDRPQTLEGKVLATADALAHLKTDFYLYFAWRNGADLSLEQVKKKVLAKSRRDFNAKIAFDEIRAETQADYDVIQNLFSR